MENVFQSKSYKQAQDIIFNRKVKYSDPPLTFNNNIVYHATLQKHLGIILDNPLHKKWSFPLRISSVNVTKSAGNCGFIS